MESRDTEAVLKRIVGRMEGQELLDDRTCSRVIDECIFEELGDEEFSLRQRIAIKKEIYNTLRRYDILSDLLDDAEVTEIMVNGPDRIFYEKAGKLYRYSRAFRSEEALENLIQQIVSAVNRQINEAEPVVDARLPTGERVHCILKPIAIDGPVVSIRKFSKNRYGMEQLVEMNSISSEAAEYLKTLVEAKYNIFICGGTGSGKTTFLNGLSEYIGPDERIITIEDAAELQIKSGENLVRLETRNANREGCRQISIRELIRSALRMRPDRLIVGEVRGEEAIDMIQAMNTGHDGSLSTGHANSPEDMLKRLETMILMGIDMPLKAVRGQISSAVDIIVSVARLRDGSRHVVSVKEVLPMEEGEIPTSTLFEFRETGEGDGKVEGRLEYTGRRLERREKLKRSGKSLAAESVGA